MQAPTIWRRLADLNIESGLFRFRNDLGDNLEWKDNTKATLYDIVDDLQWKSSKNFATKHFMERVKVYNEEGFEFRIYNVNIKGD